MRQRELTATSLEDAVSEGAPPTDGELLARWCEKADRSALELIIRRHGGMVLGTCRRVLGHTPEADDAFQAVFLILVRKAPSLKRPDQVAGWLHGVALRVAFKARAQRTRRLAREVTMVEPVVSAPSDDTEDLRRLLDEELQRLPDKYRLPILLCELEGCTLEQAAHQLGWPKGTVAGRLSRGREVLRQRLDRRRRGLILPLMLPGSPTTSDTLIAATVETALGSAKKVPPVALANAVLREWGSRCVGLALLLILTAGLLAALAWHAQSVAAEQPAVQVPSCGGKTS